MENEAEYCKKILDLIVNDDIAAFKIEIQNNGELLNYKMGNMPLVSVAILFNSRTIIEYLLPIYKSQNVFSEHDAPSLLLEKQMQAFSKYSLVFQTARFIEPCEVAFVVLDATFADTIIKVTGLKTITSKNRMETLLNDVGYKLQNNGNSYGIVKIRNKRSGRFKILLFTAIIACMLAVSIPMIVLACINVTVNYYDGLTHYGKEDGVRGGDITIENPEKEGFTFLGWFYDELLTISANGKLPEKDANLYAGWKINQYTVSFDISGYEIENEFEVIRTADYGTKIIMPIPKITGKLFVGWYDEKGSLANDNILKKNLTLTPKFVDFSDNSESNPYEITKPEDMLYLSEQEGFFTFADGLVFNENYIPLGMFSSYSKGFKGTLIGNSRRVIVEGSSMPIFLRLDKGASVSDLNILVKTDIELNDYSVDKFGVLVAINFGEINNVNINFAGSGEGSNTIKITSDKAITSVGGLVGSSSGVIKDCTVSGNLYIDIMSVYPTVSYSAGLAGANTGKVESCTSDATYRVNIWNGGFASIVGYNSGEITLSNNLSNLFIYGNMNALNENIDKIQCGGGGIAANNVVSVNGKESEIGRITDCKNSGKITLSTKGMTSYLGGIAGYSDGEIENCENTQTGDIVITQSEYISYVGGIVGVSAKRTYGKIISSNNSADIDGAKQGYSYLGGIVGRSIAEKDDNLLLIENSSNSGNVKNGSYLGGIAGSAINTNITKCTNTGKISTYTHTTYSFVLGGIVGGTIQSELHSCLNKGEIESVKNGIETRNYIAGLIGEAADSKVYSSVSVGKITSNGNTQALLFALINLKNGISSVENCYAIAIDGFVAYNDYDSSVDQNGNLIYTQEGMPNMPILYPNNEGIVSSLEELSEKHIDGIVVSDGKVEIR